ncbi:MAG: HPr family phosphocarrier protein, partial [Lentisphaeria bacterium]|nr:HPr family phosphocarrier protein [Lentisphaeria bacterium]
MVTKQTVVVNEFGIHLRPSGVIARETADCTSSLCVTSPSGGTADPRQVLALLSLAITCGTTV